MATLEDVQASLRELTALVRSFVRLGVVRQLPFVLNGTVPVLPFKLDPPVNGFVIVNDGVAACQYRSPQTGEWIDLLPLEAQGQDSLTPVIQYIDLRFVAAATFGRIITAR